MANAYSSGQTALLVIDVQQALFEQKHLIYDAVNLLHRINGLIVRAHEAHAPVIFFQHINKGILRQEAAGWALHPALKPEKDDMFLTKRHGSAFKETPLHNELQTRGITSVVICGLTTHGCVKATCKDAVQHGYPVVLVQDGHSSYHEQAARLIDEWNQKLRQQAIAVQPAEKIVFPVNQMMK